MMAFQKYIIEVEDITLALKFNPMKKVGYIGGLSRFKEYIDIILSEYFGVQPTKSVMVQKNKIRCEFRCTDEVFKEGKKNLVDHGFFIQPTSNLFNIMR